MSKFKISSFVVMIIGWIFIIASYIWYNISKSLYNANLYKDPIYTNFDLFFYPILWLVGALLIPIGATLYSGYVGALNAAILSLVLLSIALAGYSDDPLLMIMYPLALYAISALFTTAIYRYVQKLRSVQNYQ